MKQTIFEYGVTEYELDKLDANRNANRYIHDASEHKRLYDLFVLFKIRGDEQQAGDLWETAIKPRFIVKPIR